MTDFYRASIELFGNRKKELEDYQIYLEKLNEEDFSNVTKNVKHILLANTYLLLYNTVEAVVTQIIEDIHSDIGDYLRSQENHKEIGIDDLHENLYTHILDRFITNQKPISQRGIQPSTTISILKKWLEEYGNDNEKNKNYLFSGNIDSQTIRTIGEKYGFYDKEDESIHKKLSHPILRKIKGKRNQMAHGEKSFSEIGREFTYSDIKKDIEETITALQDLISVTEIYINQKKYLRSS